MRNPLARVTTSTGVKLHGLHVVPDMNRTNTVVLHLHGIAGNFYENPFIENLIDFYTSQGLAFMPVNTEFHDLSSLEGRFETCLDDISAWLEFASQAGYSNVILESFSFGSFQLPFFLNSDRVRSSGRFPAFKALVLMAPVDNVSLYWGGSEEARAARVERVRAIANEDPSALVPKDIFDGWLLSTGTFLNLVDFNTNVDIFPFRTGTLKNTYLTKIQLPTFAVKGGGDFTVIPSIESEMAQLRDIGYDAVQIPGAPHNFEQHEPELVAQLSSWLRDHQLI